MTAPGACGRRARVLDRGHRLTAAPLLLLLLAALFAAAPWTRPPAAIAQEDKGKDGAGKEKPKDGEGKEGAKDPSVKDPAPKEEPPKKKTEEETLLEALGASWKAGNSKALAARFPEKRKVTLRLPGVEGGDYRAEQARALLDGYFAGRAFGKVELKSVKEMTGTFSLEYTRASDRRTVKAELLLVLGTEEKKRVLVSVRETP